MKEQILNNINNPGELERLYRGDKTRFRREFMALYTELKGSPVADTWYERLHYSENEKRASMQEEIRWGDKREITLVALLILIAWVVAKIPAITGIDEEFFYTRNIGFVVFPALTLYFAVKNRLPKMSIIYAAAVTIVSLVFINAMPHVKESDTLILTSIHIPVLLWGVLGFAFTGRMPVQNARKSSIHNTHLISDKANTRDTEYSVNHIPGQTSMIGKFAISLDFLRYNGDLIVMTTLILIAGGIMSAITVGLFNLIGINIEGVYFDYVAVFGISAAPIAATHIIRVNPHLVAKVSPLIAKIFSPLVLIMLIIFLAAMAVSGKDPYNDREFLIIFNALLVGVLAIIFFAVSGNSEKQQSGFGLWIIKLLASVTIPVNLVSLSAILYRIAEWGVTPNRAAVLGLNILILINLIIVTITLFKRASNTGRAITNFLPLYIIWAAIVAFLFPFGF